VLAVTAGELGAEAKAISPRYGDGVEIIGPADSPLAKIRGEHRMQMLIKGQNSKVLHTIAAQLAEEHATSSVKITIDVDPENFM
jgi:primosomal protein N' (replication factor Y)